MTRDQILNYTTLGYTTDADTRFNWERIRDRYADISENHTINWATLLELIDRNMPPLNPSSNTPNGYGYTIDGTFFDEEAKVTITRSPKPVQLSEHELLKFLEEE